MDIQNINTVLDSKMKEYDKLFDQVERADQKKITMMKIALAVFSIITTAFIALFSSSDSFSKFIQTWEGMAIVSGILIGMGAVNLSIIKHLISYMHQRIFFVRQLNCTRHAVDACTFFLIEGKFPDSDEEIMNKNTEYFCAIGRHRKLPIFNDTITEYLRDVFEAADKFSIYVVTILTIIISITPIILTLSTHKSSWFGLIGGILIATFVYIVSSTLKKAKEDLEKILNANKIGDNWEKPNPQSSTSLPLTTPCEETK